MATFRMMSHPAHHYPCVADEWPPQTWLDPHIPLSVHVCLVNRLRVLVTISIRQAMHACVSISALAPLRAGVVRAKTRVRAQGYASRAA